MPCSHSLGARLISDSAEAGGWVLLILVRKWAIIISGQNAFRKSLWASDKRHRPSLSWGLPGSFEDGKSPCLSLEGSLLSPHKCITTHARTHTHTHTHTHTNAYQTHIVLVLHMDLSVDRMCMQRWVNPRARTEISHPCLCSPLSGKPPVTANSVLPKTPPAALLQGFPKTEQVLSNTRIPWTWGPFLL